MCQKGKGRGKWGYGYCPFCGEDADADEVDIGVGMQQCGPVYCPVCQAYMDDAYPNKWQSGPEDAARLQSDES